MASKIKYSEPGEHLHEDQPSENPGRALTECKMVKKTRVAWIREIRIVNYRCGCFGQPTVASQHERLSASKFAHDLPEKVLIKQLIIETQL